MRALAPERLAAAASGPVVALAAGARHSAALCAAPRARLLAWGHAGVCFRPAAAEPAGAARGARGSAAAPPPPPPPPGAPELTHPAAVAPCAFGRAIRGAVPREVMRWRADDASAPSAAALRGLASPDLSLTLLSLIHI